MCVKACILVAGVVLKVNTVWGSMGAGFMRKSTGITVGARFLEQEFLADCGFVGVVDVPAMSTFADA